jgi:CubicO group peptidase (beta-lactamase class C family)
MILNGGSYLGRHYLSAAAVKEMTSVQTGDLPLTPPDDAGYGFGWLVARQLPGRPAPASLGTFGHGGAYSTRLTIDPVQGLVTVLMVQRAETPPQVRADAGEVLRQAVLADYGR